LGRRACIHKVGAERPARKLTEEAKMSKERFYVGIDVGCSEVWAVAGKSKARKFSHDDLYPTQSLAAGGFFLEPI
jgi:hypothetical protein